MPLAVHVVALGDASVALTAGVGVRDGGGVSVLDAALSVTLPVGLQTSDAVCESNSERVGTVAVIEYDALLRATVVVQLLLFEKLTAPDTLRRRLAEATSDTDMRLCERDPEPDGEALLLNEVICVNDPKILTDSLRERAALKLTPLPLQLLDKLYACVCVGVTADEYEGLPLLLIDNDDASVRDDVAPQRLRVPLRLSATDDEGTDTDLDRECEPLNETLRLNSALRLPEGDIDGATIPGRPQ